MGPDGRGTTLALGIVRKGKEFNRNIKPFSTARDLGKEAGGVHWQRRLRKGLIDASPGGG